jgi:hypothetical protein
MSESVNRKPTTLETFCYPEASALLKMDNQQMAILNYMASRIRAALFKWEDDSGIQGSNEWWYKGLQNELVRYKIKF